MANNETPNPADNAGGANPADAAANSSDAGKPGDSRRGDNRGGGRGGSRGPRKDFSPPKYQDKDGNELIEKVVFINRCSKVVKGGRRFSFSALVVSGNQKGSVGVGFGKANEVAECIRKANETASKSLQKMQLNDGTIPHEIYAESGGGKVLLKPASPGTGIIAGGGVRAVCEAVGITDVLAKSIGSNNHANVVKATLKALSQLRNRDEILTLRGKKKEKAI